jgi:hypothetical protein
MNSPLILTKNDLLKYPHLKERVENEDHVPEKRSTYYRQMMEYREKYHILLAGILGTGIGAVITVVAMVI